MKLVRRGQLGVRINIGHIFDSYAIGYGGGGEQWGRDQFQNEVNNFQNQNWHQPFIHERSNLADSIYPAYRQNQPSLTTQDTYPNDWYQVPNNMDLSYQANQSTPDYWYAAPTDSYYPQPSYHHPILQPTNIPRIKTVPNDWRSTPSKTESFPEKKAKQYPQRVSRRVSPERQHHPDPPVHPKVPMYKPKVEKDVRILPKQNYVPPGPQQSMEPQSISPKYVTPRKAVQVKVEQVPNIDIRARLSEKIRKKSAESGHPMRISSYSRDGNKSMKSVIKFETAPLKMLAGIYYNKAKEKIAPQLSEIQGVTTQISASRNGLTVIMYNQNPEKSFEQILLESGRI